MLAFVPPDFGVCVICETVWYVSRTWTLMELSFIRFVFFSFFFFLFFCRFRLLDHFPSAECRELSIHGNWERIENESFVLVTNYISINIESIKSYYANVYRHCRVACSQHTVCIRWNMCAGNLSGFPITISWLRPGTQQHCIFGLKPSTWYDLIETPKVFSIPCVRASVDRDILKMNASKLTNSFDALMWEHAMQMPCCP